MSFIQWCWERGAKSHRNCEDEEEAKTKKAIKELGVFVSQTFYSFFPILFLPSKLTHTHTHDPHQRPTTHTHYPRHLATLARYSALSVRMRLFNEVEIWNRPRMVLLCVGIFGTAFVTFYNYQCRIACAQTPPPPSDKNREKRRLWIAVR